ncbi:MAG: hypothetical protein V3R37_09835 [Rhodospirillales bacterium]
MKPHIGILLIAAFALTIGACTKQQPEKWQKSGAVPQAKPGAIQSDWNSVRINCRSFARRKIDREYRAEASQIGSGEYRSGATLSRTMNRYEAKKRERALFEACLKSQGYEKAPPKDNK